MYKHILIPTDGSALAERAVSAGIEFARKASARVTLFTAVPAYRPPSEGELMARKFVSIAQHERKSEKTALEVLDPGAKKARAAGLEFDTDFVQADEPWQAIIDAAKRHGCDAIFMASHGRNAFARLVHGSQTVDVLAHSDIPTVVVRPKSEEAAMYKHILIPTDGSQVAEKAVTAGIEFARETGAQVTFFTAVPEYALPTDGAVIAGDFVSPQEYATNSEKAAAGALAKALEQARAARLRFDTDYAQSDEPWKAIVAAAQRHGCDAIFMGSHGRTAFARLLHGSQTVDVLSHTDIPTVVYR